MSNQAMMVSQPEIAGVDTLMKIAETGVSEPMIDPATMAESNVVELTTDEAPMVQIEGPASISAEPKVPAMTNGEMVMAETGGAKSDGCPVPAELPNATGSLSVYFDRARTALEQARTIADVKNVADIAGVLTRLARASKDIHLELDAAEIRARVLRQLGQLMDAQRRTVGLNTGGRPGKKTASKRDEVSWPTLKQAGIGNHLAHAARGAAGLSEEDFEEKIAEWRLQSLAAKRVKLLRFVDPKRRNKYSAHPLIKLADLFKGLLNGPLELGEAITADLEEWLERLSDHLGLIVEDPSDD
jgi:hypothetical protein